MIVPGKLYSYCGASKIPMWDGDLLQERSYSNCIGQLKQNDIIMVIDVLHIRKKHFQSVTHIKLLNTNGIIGIVCAFSKVAEKNFKQF